MTTKRVKIYDGNELPPMDERDGSFLVYGEGSIGDVDGGVTEYCCESICYLYTEDNWKSWHWYRDDDEPFEDRVVLYMSTDELQPSADTN